MLVEYAGVLVSVDARLPNALIAEMLAAGRLEPFRRYAHFKREVQLGESRLDFRLEGPVGVCWVEVKSVTLVEDGVARFPDAPTVRGVRHLSMQREAKRHLRELIAAAGRGEQAAVVFVIQRPDARRFVPHDQADAAFGAALREAANSGVGVYAWACEVSRRAIRVDRRVAITL